MNLPTSTPISAGALPRRVSSLSALSLRPTFAVARGLMFVIALLALGAVAARAASPISFQHLAPTDSIHVRFTSNGCFHSEVCEFDFEQSAAFTAKVTLVDRRWNDAKKREEDRQRTVLGKVRLSASEVAGLDRLFAFYRTKKRGGCTTVDQISATLKRGDVIVSTESFTDASCATYAMKNVTRLSTISAKLRAKKP